MPVATISRCALTQSRVGVVDRRLATAFRWCRIASPATTSANTKPIEVGSAMAIEMGMRKAMLCISQRVTYIFRALNPFVD